VGWEKVACWSTKAAISLKCVKIQEKLPWAAYRKSQTLFRTVPSRPPTASPSQDWRSQPHPKAAITIISGTRKATNFKFGRYIERVLPRKTFKNCGEKGAWAYPKTAQIFFEYLLLSQERVKLRTSNLAGIFPGSIRTKAP